MRITESFSHEEVRGYKFGYARLGRPSMFSIVYYVDGLLIDTGHRWARKQVLPALQGLAVDQMFLTHHHEDHTANIPQLQAQFGCEVFASEACCTLMKQPPKLSFAQKMLWGDRPAYHQITPIKDSLKTPHFSFDLIPIPGHAPDMLALYEPNRKWLFSADLYVHTHINYFMRPENMLQQIQSTRTLLELDFEVLFCSHNPQLTNGKQKLKKKLAFLTAFYEEVKTYHEEGLSAKEIFRAMKLKEDWNVRFLSGGHLSKMNMVRSVIRTLSH